MNEQDKRIEILLNIIKAKDKRIKKLETINKELLELIKEYQYELGVYK